MKNKKSWRIDFSAFRDKWIERENFYSLWDRKLFWAKLILVFILVILWVRIFYLQVIKHPYYYKKAKSRSIASYVIKAPRGEIITADGVVVATNRAVFQLYIDVESIEDEEALLKKLALLLKEDYGLLKERYYLAKKKALGRILLKRNLAWDEVARLLVRQYYLPGVIVEIESERYYPYGEAYFHVLGYVAPIDDEEYKKLKDKGYSSEDFIGKKGLERQYEDYLKGINGRIEIERDAKGRLGRVIGIVEPKAGADLIITLRHDLQMGAYELLKEKRGAIVALSPKDGSILTMVSAPSIDPNKFISGFEQGEWEKIVSNPQKPLLNKALQAYPPGSTFKLITAVAGLKSGLIKGLNWSVFCPGSFPYGNHVFRCWERKGHGSVNLIKAIALSCDVYFYTVGARLDVDYLAQVARTFGLGSPSSLGFKEEKAGLVPDRDWKRKHLKAPWHQGETVILAIGQGYILTTPLQMAIAYMVFANGGNLWKPYLVSEIKKNDNILYKAQPQLVRRIEFHSDHLEWLREGLREVVESGTGKAAKVPGILVWGKTGTAQVVALHKKVKALEHHAWFVSYAGNGTPEVVSTVFIEHGGGGGAVAAPLAGEFYRIFYKLPLLLKTEPPQEERVEEEIPFVDIPSEGIGENATTN
ncbi:MAG: penicillin-binding protein 2 [Caldimicrobium sp.]